MQRFERRIKILKGKRNIRVDAGTIWLASARRGRVARRVRTLLRRLDPVVMITPRWSQVHRFLDDVATDLSLGSPLVRARTLSVAPLQGRSALECWTWLANGIAEFLGVPLEGPASQAVSRHGFRTVLAGLLRRSTRQAPSALLVHGFECVHVEAQTDLLRAFQDHVDEAGLHRRVTLAVAGAVDSPALDLPSAERFVLPDFAPSEAVDVLAEYVGPVDEERARVLLGIIGGVPALLDRVGADAEASGRLPVDRDAIWRALGPLAEEVRGAVAICSSVDGAGARLEEVARAGGMPENAATDRMLVRAGLLGVDPTSPGRVVIRAAVFADLAASRI